MYIVCDMQHWSDNSEYDVILMYYVLLVLSNIVWGQVLFIVNCQ